MRTSNRKSRECVEQCLPFKASNLHADIENNLYVVWSYGWYPLLVCNLTTMQWYKNEEKYSPSTSRQLLNCTPFGINFNYRSKNYLIAMINAMKAVA